MSMVLNERAPSVARKARQEFAAAVSEVQALTKPSTPLETQQRQLIDLLIAQVSANDKGFADEVAETWTNAAAWPSSTLTAAMRLQ